MLLGCPVYHHAGGTYLLALESSPFHSGDSWGEGLFDAQLSLPLPAHPAPAALPVIRRRDGSEAPFDRRAIAEAIFEAAQVVGGEDRDLAYSLASAVEIYLGKRFQLGGVPTVDHVNDAVERVLIQMSHARTALAYARRRDRRARIRRLREGDLRVLFTELEEARFEREAEEARGEAVLFGRHVAGKLLAWDRDRTAHALAREAGLSAEQADSVARAIERQLIQSGIRNITVGLVRELAGAELLDRGWREAFDRRRQLGLSLYDTENLLRGRTPETVSQHPGATSDALAQAVKREYALAQVMPADIAEAHLRGSIHISRLSAIDRIECATHALPYVVRHGVWAPGGRQLAPAAAHADTLLAHMVKWDELMRHYASGAMRWSAVNVFFAPFLYGLEPPEMRQFAQMLLYEYAYRALAASGQRDAAEIEIVWSVPQSLKNVCIVGPGGEVMEDTYGQFEHTVQQFAWALLEELHAAAAEGAPLPAPWPVVTLEGPSLRAPGQERFIGLVATAIAAGAPVEVRFEREAAPAPEEPWAASEVSLAPVVLNLPRAAYRASAPGQFDVELEAQLALAVQAHRARRSFLESLATDRTAPLGMIASEDSELRYVNLESAASPIAVEGLREAVLVLTGTEPGASETATARAIAILTHLGARCAYFAKREGFPIILTENLRAEVSQRLATVDLAEHATAARAVIRMHDIDGPLTYTHGTQLADGLALNPWENALTQSRLKACLHHASPLRVALPDTNMSPESITAFLLRLYRDSPCSAVLLTLKPAHSE